MEWLATLIEEPLIPDPQPRLSFYELVRPEPSKPSIWATPEGRTPDTRITLINKLDREIDLVWMNWKGEEIVYHKNVPAGKKIT